MLCPRQGANCCYIDNVKLLQDLINMVQTIGFFQPFELEIDRDSR